MINTTISNSHNLQCYKLPINYTTLIVDFNQYQAYIRWIKPTFLFRPRGETILQLPLQLITKTIKNIFIFNKLNQGYTYKGYTLTPSFEANSNTKWPGKLQDCIFQHLIYYFLTMQLLQIVLSHISYLHDTNTCFCLDFNYLYERFLKFNETCKRLTLDQITKRNLRYIMQQFRKQRAVLKNCLEESSTDNEKWQQTSPKISS